jgi:hypothetical protein
MPIIHTTTVTDLRDFLVRCNNCVVLTAIDPVPRCRNHGVRYMVIYRRGEPPKLRKYNGRDCFSGGLDPILNWKAQHWTHARPYQ